jgi:hypothetical protein
MMSLTSTITWIFVVRPPREWLGRDPFFTRAGAMLVGSHDRCVDHGVFIVRIVCQGLEKSLPNAAHGPAREAPVRIAPAAKTFRQIAPRCPNPEFPDHRVDEKTIAQIAVATPPMRTRSFGNCSTSLIRGCILRKSRCRPRWSPWSAIRPERTVEEHKPAGHAGGFFFGGCCGRRAVDG